MDGAPPHRVTYCSLQSPNPRLFCFKENLSRNSGLEGQITTSSVDLQEKKSPIIQLETKLAVVDDRITTKTNCLLAIHQNGAVNCYTENLERKLWSSSILDKEGQQVLLASLTDVEQAKRGLLKHREDILASLGQIESNQTRDLLVILTCSKSLKSSNEAKKLSLQILDVSNANINGDDRGYQPRKLFSIGVPHINEIELETSAFTIHLASGCLYQQTPTSVIVFDMTDLLPKIVHEVAVDEGDISSFLRLSLDTIALGKHSSFSVVSLPFCSIQGESRADGVSTSRDAVLRLLSYFDSTKVAVAMKGRSLIAMQVPKSSPDSLTSRKRKREGTLADSIGRGSFAKRSLLFSKYSPDSSIKNLGRLSIISKDDAWESQRAKWTDSTSQGLKDISNTMIKELEMKNPHATHSVDQRKVSYLLSKIFTVQRPEPSKDGKPSSEVHLEIAYLERKTILKWLLYRGYLTKHRIEDSLRQDGSLRATENLPPAAMIEELSKHEPSLKLLSSVLSSQTPLDPSELVYAVAIVIQRYHASDTPENRNQSPEDNDPPRKSNKTPPLPPLTYQHLMHLLLARISHLPHAAITHALRTQLQKPTLLSLIDALRLQIATAGWFSPYDNDPDSPTPPHETTPNNGLLHITHLLNSTIDAIGAGGWILGAASSDSGIIAARKKKENSIVDDESNNDAEADQETQLAQTANTLSYMKAEISAALEGIQEAVYLQGILNEVLLCGKDALGSQHSQAKKQKDVALAVVKKEGSGSGNGNGNALMGALPLGLKLAHKVSKKRVVAGGELQERTKRGIQRLRSQMVGEYSFERLRV